VKIPADLLPQKAVAEGLGVSRVTLWRARNSGLAGFPQLIFVRNLVFWKKADVETLQKVMERYRGRVAFEKHRRTAGEAAMKPTSKVSTEAQMTRSLQLDLFE
jgi:predicted DNA-binding transcriptional regulator AlpA